jgi:hypothetical protein
VLLGWFKIENCITKDGVTIKVENGQFETSAVDAVACIPKNCEFPLFGIKGKKWSKTAKRLGAVALFKSLASDSEGATTSTSSASPAMVTPIPEESQVSEEDPAPPLQAYQQQQQQQQERQQLPQQQQEYRQQHSSPQQHQQQRQYQTPVQPKQQYATILPSSQQQLQYQATLSPPPVQQEGDVTLASPTAEMKQRTPSPQHVVSSPVMPPPSPQQQHQQQAESATADTAVSMTVNTSTGSLFDHSHGYPSSADAPVPKGGACYLVYESDSSGRIVEHYSMIPVEGAIGRWSSDTKKIAGFKFKRNLGKNVLIGNCSAGVQGRKNYCSGWCQFVRSAQVMDASVMLWDPLAGNKGMAVDVYMYYNDSRPTHQTQRLKPGIAYTTEKLLAVACIPKNTPFFEGMAVDLLKWLADGSSYGYSSKMA